MLRTTNHARQDMAGPSNSHQSGKDPFVVRETHVSRYYRLAQIDGKDLMDPIYGKCLKHYYA